MQQIRELQRPFQSSTAPGHQLVQVAAVPSPAAAVGPQNQLAPSLRQDWFVQNTNVTQVPVQAPRRLPTGRHGETGRIRKQQTCQYPGCGQTPTFCPGASKGEAYCLVKKMDEENERRKQQQQTQSI